MKSIMSFMIFVCWTSYASAADLSAFIGTYKLRDCMQFDQVGESKPTDLCEHGSYTMVSLVKTDTGLQLKFTDKDSNEVSLPEMTGFKKVIDQIVYEGKFVEHLSAPYWRRTKAVDAKLLEELRVVFWNTDDVSVSMSRLYSNESNKTAFSQFFLLEKQP